MKNYLTLFVLTIIVFGTFTIYSSKIESPFDGNDIYGFPFEFYKIYGGKRTYYPPNEFSISNFTIDLIIAFIASLALITIFKKLYK